MAEQTKYVLDLTPKELALLTAMMTYTHGKLSNDEDKAMVGKLSMTSWSEEYIILCGKIDKLAVAALDHIRTGDVSFA